jgi:hypothetical protein
MLLKNVVANFSHTLEIYALFFCMIAMVVIVGRRITALLPETLNETYGFYLAPICGLGVFLQMAIIYGWLHPYQFPISLGLVLLLLVVALSLERDHKSCFTDILQTYVFAVICSLPVLYLIIFYNGYNHGTDSITYLSQSQWLQAHSFKELVTVSPFYPANSAISQYQHQGSRMGASFLLGFFQSLFHQRWSYYIYLPVTSLALIGGCLGIGSFIRQMVHLNRRVILALSLIPAFSYNGFVYGAKWGFYPMTNGLAFAVSLSSVLSMLSVYCFSMKQPLQRLGVVLIPLALLSSGFLLAYNEPFPIFVLGIGLFFIALWLKSPEQRKFLIQFILVYVLELVVFTNYEFVRIYKNLFLTLSIAKTSAGTGWPIFWWPSQFANFSLGLKMPIAPWKLKSAIISAVILPLVLGIMLYWFRKAWKEDKAIQLPLILLLSLQFAFILAFIKFRYFSPNNYPGEVGLSFLQFKVAKYASPFSLVFLGACLGLIWQHYQKFKKEILLGYGVIFVFAMSLQIFVRDECGHWDFIVHKMRGTHSPFEVFLNLRDFLEKTHINAPVYADFGPDYFKLKELVALSFQDKKILSDYRDDGYLSYGLTDKQMHLAPWKTSPVLLMENTPYAKSAQVFDFFPVKLLLPPYQYVIIKSKEGISKSQFEASGRIQDWSNASKVSYHFKAFGNIKTLNLHVTIDNPNEGARLLLKDAQQKVLASQALHSAGAKTYQFEVDLSQSHHIELVLEQLNYAKSLENFSISDIYFTEPKVTL